MSKIILAEVLPPNKFDTFKEVGEIYQHECAKEVWNFWKSQVHKIIGDVGIIITNK